MSPEEISRGFLCKDCGKDTLHRIDPRDYFMLKNHIWHEIQGGKGMLCFTCAEKRLGRSITTDDLMDCPLNYENGLLQEEVENVNP